MTYMGGGRMYWLAGFIGSMVAVAVISGGVYAARKKRGADWPVSSVIYATWVSLAIYGLASREDYEFVMAANYIIAGLLCAGVAWVAAKGRQRREIGTASKQ